MSSKGRVPKHSYVTGKPLPSHFSILFENGSYRQLPSESCLSDPHQNATFGRDERER